MIKNTYEPPVALVKHELKLNLNDIKTLLRDADVEDLDDKMIGLSFNVEDSHPVSITWEE